MPRTTYCPTCDEKLPPGAMHDSPHFPFCSQRCREVDLLRWSNGEYSIAEQLPPEMCDPELFDPYFDKPGGPGSFSSPEPEAGDDSEPW